MIRRFAFLAFICVLCSTAAIASDEVFQYKGRVGFTAGEDKLVDHQIVDDGRKLVIIGRQLLQVWDVKSGKLISSAPHNINQFAPRGFLSDYLLLGLPRAFQWRDYLVDPNGKWIATIEKVGANLLRSVVVRDLTTLKTTAVLETPKVSVDFIAFDETSSHILTMGETDKTGAYGTFETANFTADEILVIPNHKWHRKIGDGSKMLVGTGDTKVIWSAAMSKEGGSLTLRDVKTGAVEKSYTAGNLKPDTSFYDTIVSDDEKYLISKRDGRVFVWELAGDGTPFLEVSKPQPKSKFDIEAIVDARFIVVFVDNELRIFDITKGGKRVLTVTPSNPKEDLDFTSIVGKRYALVRVQAQLHVFDLETGARKFAIKTDNDPKDRVELRDVSKDERYLAVADDLRVAVYDIGGDGKPVFEVRRDSPKERFWNVSFFNERGLVAVARLNNSEKKAPKTEFYDFKSGKLEFTAPIETYATAKFTPDNGLLYQVRLGGVDVWNAITNKNFTQVLQTHTDEDVNPVTGEKTTGETYNVENVIFSPDLKYFVRHGRGRATVFETATGRQLQMLIDPNVFDTDDKKDKSTQKPGVGSIGWIREGELLFVEEPFRLFGNQRTLALWEVKK